MNVILLNLYIWLGILSQTNVFVVNDTGDKVKPGWQLSLSQNHIT